MSELDAKIQIRVSKAVNKRAKALAIEKDTSVTELVLEGLTKLGDAKLTKLIEKDKEDRNPPGRPSASSS